MAERRGRKGAVERALAQIVVGAVKSTREHDALNREMGFAEVEQQYQVPIEGTVGVVPIFVSVDIEFDYPMHFAPGQRDSELDRPHFWASAEMDRDIMVTAIVREWNVNSNNGAYIGATVKIALVAGATVNYTGRIHLTFQGWGALDETDSPEGD